MATFVLGHGSRQGGQEVWTPALTGLAERSHLVSSDFVILCSEKCWLQKIYHYFISIINYVYFYAWLAFNIKLDCTFLCYPHGSDQPLSHRILLIYVKMLIIT
jgi:hypothetical protein